MKKGLIVVLLNIFYCYSYGTSGFSIAINKSNNEIITIDACTPKMTISADVDMPQNINYYFTLYNNNVKIINKATMTVTPVEGWGSGGAYSTYQVSISQEILRSGGTYRASISTYAGIELATSNEIAVTVVPYTSPKLTFNINDNNGAVVTICDGSVINLNGSLSTCEDKYKVSVIQSDIIGNALGSEILNQYDGNVPNVFSIANMCAQKNFKLENSKYYKITLSILHSGEWKSLSKIIYMLPEVLYLSSSDLPIGEYSARNQIVLSSGFNMKSNGFKAYITSCTKSYLEDSDDLSFDISNTIDLPKIDQLLVLDSSITIYPQPSTGIVYIKTNDNRDIESLEIFDNSGLTLLPKIYPNDNNFKLDLSKLSNGCFIVKAKTKTSSYSKTIIIKK